VGVSRRGFAVAVAAGCCVLLGAGGCGGEDGARTQGSFTEGGVHAAVTLERTGAGTLAVTATLTPEQGGFHLYSLGLPDGGVDGLGIPTRLAVSAPLIATAGVTASARAYDLRPAGLDVALPVYPDGPVTLHLSVGVDGASTPADAHVHLTYGACSSTKGCLIPVRDHVVTLAVPPAR
jgi:hypothetical protein